MKQIIVALAALMVAVSLAACSSDSGGSSAASSSFATGSSSSSSIAVLDAEDVVTISLDYSAGTGYEWRCSTDPEGVVAQVGQATEDLAEGEDVAGGPLQDRFTFRAQKPGEVVITFNLVRGWEEGEPAETQVYAFTVSDDLEMTLNPYKSSFENEPEWGSNS